MENNTCRKLVEARDSSAIVRSDNGVIKITVSKPKRGICSECGQPFLRIKNEFVIGRGTCEEDAWQDAASVLGIKYT